MFLKSNHLGKFSHSLTVLYHNGIQWSPGENALFRIFVEMISAAMSSQKLWLYPPMLQTVASDRLTELLKIYKRQRIGRADKNIPPLRRIIEWLRSIWWWNMQLVYAIHTVSCKWDEANKIEWAPIHKCRNWRWTYTTRNVRWNEDSLLSVT